MGGLFCKFVELIQIARPSIDFKCSLRPNDTGRQVETDLSCHTGRDLPRALRIYRSWFRGRFFLTEKKNQEKPSSSSSLSAGGKLFPRRKFAHAKSIDLWFPSPSDVIETICMHNWYWKLNEPVDYNFIDIKVCMVGLVESNYNE